MTGCIAKLYTATYSAIRKPRDRCYETVHRDGLCWTHWFTIESGMATREQVMTGTRAKSPFDRGNGERWAHLADKHAR